MTTPSDAQRQELVEWLRRTGGRTWAQRLPEETEKHREAANTIEADGKTIDGLSATVAERDAEIGRLREALLIDDIFHRVGYVEAAKRRLVELGVSGAADVPNERLWRWQIERRRAALTPSQSPDDTGASQ